MQLGELLSAALNSAGYFTLVYPEYPSRIRGGDNNVQIVISNSAQLTPRQRVDALFALDKNLADAHRREVKPNGSTFNAVSLGLIDVPAVKSNPLVKNTALAGLIWRFLGLEKGILSRQIKKTFPKYTAVNLEAAEAGWKLASKTKGLDLAPTSSKIFGATGNEVFASSALKADCQYASIYPMTPITSLARYLAKSKIKVIAPEDEIFAALSTLGASYAGKRALTATSGGGFCLMTEAIGLAAMAEIPLVIILGQRSGPSSGMPTYSSQADLNFAIWGGHGDFEKIVLAPGDLEEIARLTPEAFNLAERYQIPVIILTDKYLSESRFSTNQAIDKIKIKIDRGKRYERNSKIYNRYKLTKDGISPRAYPGETTFLTNSYEHDEEGFSADDVQTRQAMMAKRARKLASLPGGYEIYGHKSAKEIVVGWGSTKSQLVELSHGFPQLKFIHIWRPWPFPEKMKSELKRARKVIVAENNFSGQMAKIIENETSVKVAKILKDDGRPFFFEELTKAIEAKL